MRIEFHFVMASLAVWRITHLLNAEDGPWQKVARLRRKAGAGFWGELLDCFYCLSLWVAAPFAYFLSTAWRERAMLWLALSAGAILLQRITSRTVDWNSPAIFKEDPPGE